MTPDLSGGSPGLPWDQPGTSLTLPRGGAARCCSGDVSLFLFSPKTRDAEDLKTWGPGTAGLDWKAGFLKARHLGVDNTKIVTNRLKKSMMTRT